MPCRRLPDVRFSTKVLLLQLLTVFAVVAVCSGIFAWMSVERLKQEAMTSAVSIARSVAEDPQVRSGVTEGDAGRGLADLAAGVETRTGALFVVVTDADGIRLAHPDPQRIGQQVSTDHEAALRGEEVTAWETGTLGHSARAKVPVYALDDSVRDVSDSLPVGEVSVGFQRASVFDDLPLVLVGVGTAGVTALLIGVVASVLMQRRWERLTLGLQPEDLVELVRHQSAVLDGVEDGVLSVNPGGGLEVFNEVASRLLGIDPVGVDGARNTSVRDLGLPSRVTEELEHLGRSPQADAHSVSFDNVVVGGRVLYLDARPVVRAGRHLGTIVVVRDRTDLAALTRRLGTVQAMGSTLRVQRHEFANRIHAASGLLDAGRVDDARSFLRDMADRGPVDFPLQGAELLREPFLQSFLGGKAMEASERGVSLRVGEETLVIDDIDGPGAVEDVATVLGNLVDNAVTAALSTDGDDPWVDVTAMQDGDALTLVVSDSGDGLSGSRETETGPDVDTVHGHGIGLTLTRDLVARRDGTLWIIDPGGGTPGEGAVFGVRLPGVFATESDDMTDETPEGAGSEEHQ